MARLEGLAGEPDYVSGGPRERFSSPRWSVVRFVVLGLIAVAVGAYGGYRWGVAHERHAAAVADASELVLPTGGWPSGEVFADNSVWVAVFAANEGWGPGAANLKPGWVARYNPLTRRSQRIAVGSDPVGMGSGFGSMWVSNAGDGTVTRIDESDNKVLDTIKVGPFPFQIAPAAGGMWVTTQTDVVKINPVTNEVVVRVPIPRPPHTETASSGSAMDANANGVWVNTSYGTLVRLRPSDGRLLQTIRLQPAPTQPGMVVIQGNNVWVTTGKVQRTSGQGAGNDTYGRSNQLAEIDATTGTIIRRVPTAGYPVAGLLPERHTLLILGFDTQSNTSELIRTDWPYQVDAYIRPLRGSSCHGIVDTHGQIWTPCYFARSIQIVPASDPPPRPPGPGG